MENSIYRSIASLRAIQQSESELPLRNEACRSKFFLHSRITKKVFLFFHGFTAGPYQFEPLGNAFHKAGYNVLVPLQPGHGIAGEWSRHNTPPLPTDVRVYQQFVLEWIGRAQELGDEIIVGGLSSGANLAAWAALEHPEQVGRSLLFAPFLKGRNPLFDWLINVLPFYYEWFNKDAPGNFGYKGFRIPALRLFLELGKTVLNQAQVRRSAPMLVVSSDADMATDPGTHRQLFQAVQVRQPQSWYYCFDKSLGIGHRMTTRIEDNPYEDQLITLTQSYVESSLTWPQLQLLTRHIQKGKPADTIACAANLYTLIPSYLKNFLEWDLSDRTTGFLSSL
ncbi:MULTISPECIES: alpha/beta fold hydrolase [unclassified Leptolyngbya]|uniref:alpha/beta hydrolase n=1 Tax=unclassified Leptolyngbya TaxID=2650499 RepID=UPI001686D527|nr:MULTISPECIES: alpha/beta fold hydrolase [unclassified Leptolyngbya]MBD1912747.1 alpha/beta fold hydrolase [Leptolyngbya sp. FACHB-8]MBD2155739.1 alpha/beta fold hydrolase [Leptolyngbya sp. FACHB-16]